MAANAHEYLGNVRSLLDKAIRLDKQGKYGEALYVYNSIISACQITGKYKDLHPTFYSELFKSASVRAEAIKSAGYTPQKPVEPSPLSLIFHQAISSNNQPNLMEKPQTIQYPSVQNPPQVPSYRSSSLTSKQATPKPQPTPKPQSKISNNPTNSAPAKKQNEPTKVEKPKITFADVAGLENAKQSLYEAVLMPIKVPHLFDQADPWKGILLYGPPGTGKSYLAKAVAGEAGNITFIAPSTSELTSKWVGESEKIIRDVFEEARKKRPAIIFFDEIDSLVPARSTNDSETGRRIKTEFLIQMDGVDSDNQGILIIAATNTPWDLDSAMRRRLEKRIYIPLPSSKARLSLLQHKLRATPNTLTDEQLLKIVACTKGFSGADLAILIRDALMQPIRKITKANYFKRGKAINKDGVEMDNLWVPVDDRSAVNNPECVHKKWSELNPDEIGKIPVNIKHFAISLKKAKPSVSTQDLEKYKQWTEEFGEEGA